jgi:hypothetical protein
MSTQGCGPQADLVDLLESRVLEPCPNQIVGGYSTLDEDVMIRFEGPHTTSGEAGACFTATALRA